MVQVRTILSVMNGIFIFLGVVGIALTVYSKEKDVSDLVGTVWFAPAICLGVFTLLLGAMGAYGAAKAHGCILYTYSLITLIIAMCIIGLGAYAVSSGGEESGKEIIETAWNKAEVGVKVSDLTGRVQTTYECCGLYKLEADCIVWTTGMQVKLSNDTDAVAAAITTAGLDALSNAILTELEKKPLPIIGVYPAKGVAIADGTTRRLLPFASITQAVTNATLGVCALKADCYAGARTECTSAEAAADEACLAKTTAVADCVNPCSSQEAPAQQTCSVVLLAEFKRLYVNMGVTGVFLALVMMTAFGLSLRLACVGDQDKGDRV